MNPPIRSKLPQKERKGSTEKKTLTKPDKINNDTSIKIGFLNLVFIFRHNPGLLIKAAKKAKIARLITKRKKSAFPKTKGKNSAGV